jgi:hypothetical protein
VSHRDPLARIEDLLDSELASSRHDLIHDGPLAVGWATVELDRAVAELGAALRIPAARFVEAPGSVSLGARCLVAAGVLRAGVSLALLEPDTEARLAATLARHDEGPVALWLAVGDLTEAAAALHRAGRPIAQPHAGPLGMERLLLDGPLHGPHRLLVERPGTIRA